MDLSPKGEDAVCGEVIEFRGSEYLESCREEKEEQKQEKVGTRRMGNMVLWQITNRWSFIGFRFRSIRELLLVVTNPNWLNIVSG